MNGFPANGRQLLWKFCSRCATKLQAPVITNYVKCPACVAEITPWDAAKDIAPAFWFGCGVLSPRSLMPRDRSGYAASQGHSHLRWFAHARAGATHPAAARLHRQVMWTSLDRPLRVPVDPSGSRSRPSRRLLAGVVATAAAWPPCWWPLQAPWRLRAMATIAPARTRLRQGAPATPAPSPTFSCRR